MFRSDGNLVVSKKANVEVDESGEFVEQKLDEIIDIEDQDGEEIERPVKPLPQVDVANYPIEQVVDMTEAER